MQFHLITSDGSAFDIFHEISENEHLDNRKYTHGEFDFHIYSANMGKNPQNSLMYYEPFTYTYQNTSGEYEEYFIDGVNFSDVDGYKSEDPWNKSKKDGITTVKEVYLWEKDFETKPETPTISDGTGYSVDEIGHFTSLEYPTIIYNDFDNYDSYLYITELKGIIGITESLDINNMELKLLPYSKTTMLENTNITANINSPLSLESNAKITGVGNNTINVNSKSCFNINSATIENIKIITAPDYPYGETEIKLSGESELLNSETEIYNNSKVSLQENAILRIGTGTTARFLPGSKLILNSNSELIVESGALLDIWDSVDIEVHENANIIIENSGTLTAVGCKFGNTTGEIWNGIVSNQNGKVSLINVSIENAETALYGISMIFESVNSEFINCINGIILLDSDDYLIELNTITGNHIGDGIKLHQSNGILKKNFISNCASGVNIISCSPLFLENVIQDNSNCGILVNGYISYPTLVNPLIKDPAFNNTLKNNSIAQIGLEYMSNVYLKVGKNNIFSTNSKIPCLKTIGLLPLTKDETLPKISILATYNFWGGNFDSDVTNQPTIITSKYFDVSNDYKVIYRPYSQVYLEDNAGNNFFPYGLVEEELLSGISLDKKGYYNEAALVYEKVINDYPKEEEKYVSYTFLPNNYKNRNVNLNELIAKIDNELDGKGKKTNKKFFKQMKVCTYLKNKDYISAIKMSEELKSEAVNENEIWICDMDIALAKFLKESSKVKNKSGKDDYYKISNLLSILDGNDENGVMINSTFTETYELLQNYPNPFNPVTTIRFDLNKEGKVQLSVYNVNGQKVAELVNGVMKSGIHTFEFDGSNLNSGVYFCTLESDGQSFTKKLVLIK